MSRLTTPTLNSGVIDTNFTPLPIQKMLVQALAKPYGESVRQAQITLPRRGTKTVYAVNYQIDRAFNKFIMRPELDELRYAYGSP